MFWALLCFSTHLSVGTKLCSTRKALASSLAKMSKKDKIAELLKKDSEGKQTPKVVMVSKSYCPFCSKAKKALKILIEKGDLDSEDLEVVEIENAPDCEKIQQDMQRKTGARSVPRVFVRGKFIGGGDDVVRMQRSGELAKMLKD